MDQPNSSASQTQPQAINTRNTKNLSIKEFFTTKLMRTRSYEGGPGSPKDETPNWFDEFRARMTKRSQNKQVTSATNNEDSTDIVADSGEISAKFGDQSKSKHQPSIKEECPSIKIEENCDSNLNRIKDSGKKQKSTNELSSILPDEICRGLINKGAKSKKLQGIFTDNPKSETVLNYDRITKYGSPLTKRSGSYRKFISRSYSTFRRITSYLFPFNYNLPWKFLTLVNMTLIVILTALIIEKTPNVKVFNFLSGFIAGLIVAICCFIIIAIIALVHILPDTSESISKPENKINSQIQQLRQPPLNLIIDESEIDFISANQTSDRSQDDYSFFEVIDDDVNSDQTNSRFENPDDDDYKGWMIEFIGDYEQRNKSEFKLKLIFVKLENKILHLWKPKNNDAESAPLPVFLSKRKYDLRCVKKFSVNLLLPKNVRNRQKWVWSKKYPIKLDFIDGSETQSKVTEKHIQLTLFAKSCREKEEWFRFFKKIVEEIKLAQGSVKNIKPSQQQQQQQISSYNDDISSSSIRNLRCGSPSSLTFEGVQNNRSSHILNDHKQEFINEDISSESDPNIVRTRSCEQINQECQPTLNSYDFPEYEVPRTETNEDDGTLTKENAELFSQAIEYSNFLESQPSLNYIEYINWFIISGKDATSTCDWFNAFTGRIFFDILSHNHWSIWFKRKIQRKLRRIRLPYFMETLTLTQIDLGTNAPRFLNVGSYSFDSFGLSIDFDMSYSGGLTMTFETKLNLLKIRSENSEQSSGSINLSANASQTSQQTFESFKNLSSTDDTVMDNVCKENIKTSQSSSGSARTSGESSSSDDNDTDTSSDSSENEIDLDEISDWEDYDAEKTRQNIVRFVDKIASSRYFQSATENRYIKKKLQDISNCPLVLIVRIQSLNGILTLNVPPPQTDRIWYGFKPNPELVLKALPKMGDREVNLSHVTDWIEKKLADEFKKILVIPNMEDIVLSILKSDHLTYVSPTK